MLVERDNDEIPFIAHNFFSFDLFYFIKCYIAYTWGSKELNIGGNNSTQANYGNVKIEIKLIDSLKFYQRSLGELSSTLTLFRMGGGEGQKCPPTSFSSVTSTNVETDP